MSIQIDEDTLYYFTCLVEDKYHTLFVGWLREDLVKAFKSLKEGSSFAYIKLCIGEHTFINYVSKPLYLLEYDDDDIFEFAGDNNELDLYPSGKVPEDLGMEAILDFPSHFEYGVTPMIKYKLFNEFCINQNGIWIPLDV
jgi:hypothetical protein